MSTTTVITLDQLESSGNVPRLPTEIPTLRLSRNPNSSQSTFSLSGVKKLAQSIMAKLKSDENIKLEEAASPEATLKNKEKLRKYIGAMQAYLQEKFEEASDSLEGKTPEQQEQILAYWTAVTEFLQQVLDWLQILFLEVIELIKQGHTIEKDALKKMFAKAAESIKQAFTKQLSIDEAFEMIEKPEDVEQLALKADATRHTQTASADNHPSGTGPSTTRPGIAVGQSEDDARNRSPHLRQGDPPVLKEPSQNDFTFNASLNAHFQYNLTFNAAFNAK